MEWRKCISRKGWVALLVLALFISGVPGFSLYAQGAPSKLLSLPVYHPMVLNPAFAGSKDFSSISLTSKVSKYPDTQILNFNTRILSSNDQFSNVGLGAYIFQEQYTGSWNSGLAVTGSYHFSLDRQKLNFISIGATLKGVIAVPKDNEEAPGESQATIFRPNMDAGVYYYGPHVFGGVSATTLFGTNTGGDSTLSYSDFDRQYHFEVGYKFLISKKLGIVIEPSLLTTLDDETISKPLQQMVPYLKVYLKDFYIGTYLKDTDIFALFFQYQFPKFYTGVFLQFPRVGYLNDENIIFEVSAGINLGRGNPKFTQHRHW